MKFEKLDYGSKYTISKEDLVGEVWLVDRNLFVTYETADLDWLVGLGMARPWSSDDMHWGGHGYTGWKEQTIQRYQFVESRSAAHHEELLAIERNRQ